MQSIRHLLATLLLFASLFAAPARAAQSYDNCTGFIDSLPASITTQGTWCLRHDLTTAITSGNAITVGTNNVTLDCNDFKVGGLQAGTSSQATGIGSISSLNATVRHCNIRGFYYGIHLSGGGGHLIEDNRLDQNLFTGINVLGDNNRVRRNAVYDTGGVNPANNQSFGIYASADVTDNTVAGVFATASDTYPYAIDILGNGSVVRGNFVRGLVVGGFGTGVGIYADAPGITIDGNRVSAVATTAGNGIYGAGPNTFCSNNTVVNFSLAYTSCELSMANMTLP